MPKQTAIARAVAAAGGQGALARITGYTQPAVHYWIKTGKAPAEVVAVIEEATGISRHDLRPDIFPRPQRQEVLHG